VNIIACISGGVVRIEIKTTMRHFKT